MKIISYTSNIPDLLHELDCTPVFSAPGKSGLCFIKADEKGLSLTDTSLTGTDSLTTADGKLMVGFKNEIAGFKPGKTGNNRKK